MMKTNKLLLLCLLLMLILYSCETNSNNPIMQNDNETQVNVNDTKDVISSDLSVEDQIKNTIPIVDYSPNYNINQVVTVKFGHNEDGEQIEWLILEKDTSKALLLSKHILAYHNYHDTRGVGVTWETSNIREWLNSEFIKTLFNESELSLILSTDVVNNDNSRYGTNGGNNTLDKLFLLSIEEIQKYFFNDEQMFASSKGRDPMYWWLRSPGVYEKDAACVNWYGNLLDAGVSSYGPRGVRPALWIKY